MKIAFALCAFLIAGGLSLKAADKGDKPKADPEAAFKKMDTNGDGKLTKAEFMASPGAKKDEAKAATRWEAISKGKAEVTLDEFKAGSAGKKKKAA
jgi:hypothetical protein